MVDLKEERKYEQLRKLGQELHIPIPEAFWEFEVFDKDHNLIQRHRQRSHSWTRNAYNLLLCQMAGKICDDAGNFGAGYLSIKRTNDSIDTGGVSIAGGTLFENSGQAYRAAAADNTHGIQVGTAIDAESLEDFILTGLIAEGAGAGQLNHVLQEVPGKSYDGPSKVFTITQVRYMNNNSGGAIGVNEVALTTYGAIGTVEGLDKFVMARDKLPATVTVPDTGQLKVTYTIQLTYPA
ncbi:hypothetical protein ES705_32632 [subsurface metagenome]